MKKNYLKKTAALLLAAAMLFAMVGCGKGSKKKNDEELKNVEVPESNEMVYEGKLVNLPGASGLVDSFKMQGDKLYFTTYTYIEDENADKENEGELSGTSKTGFYSADIDGKNVTEIKTIEWPAGEYLSSWTVAEDGNIQYVKGNNSGKKGTYSVVKLDNTGNEILNVDITNSSELNPTDDKNIAMEVSKKGESVFVSENGAFIFDENAKFLYKVEAKGTMNANIAKTREGDIICNSYDEEKHLTLSLNTETKKWDKQYELSGKGSFILMNGLEYDFYYSDDSGIYGYDMAKESAVKVVDYSLSDMIGIDVSNLCMIDKGKFAGFGENSINSSMKVYSKVDPGAVIEKQTLVLGGIQIDPYMDIWVRKFNQTNKKYRIEIKDYWDWEGSGEGNDECETKLATDILTGNAPDILYLDDHFADVDMYAAKGVLEDLTPYYENDPEISLNDFFPTVINAMKSGDKLCFVSGKFWIATATGRTKDVGEKMGWNMEEMERVLEEKGNGTLPFASSFYSKMGTLYPLVDTACGDYVNWETGECSFDTTEFKKVLELSNASSNIIDDRESLFEYESKIRDGSALLGCGGATLDTMQVLPELYGEDVTFIGYPTKDKNGSYFCFTDKLGMSATSEHKEGVWEFLRTFMMKGHHDGMTGYYESVRIDDFEEMAKNKMQTGYYAKECCETYGTWEDFGCELQPVTEEQIARYKDLINHTTKREKTDYMISDIIYEEAMVYFSGDRDVDETAKIIQDRVTKYVNEKR